MTAPEFDARRTGPLAALRAWWWVAVVLVILGAVVGGLLARSKPTHYTAETRLVVGSDDLASYQVAGFAQASQNLASNYARYVDNSSVVSDRLRRDLGTRTGTLVAISASPIPQSDVVSVDVVATSKATADAGARSVANTLVELTKPTTASNDAALLRSFNSLSARAQTAQYAVSQLSTLVSRTRNPSASLQNRLVAGRTRLALLKLQTTAAGNLYTQSVTGDKVESELRVITDAAIVNDNSNKVLQTYVVAGVVGGFLIGLVLAAALESMRRRRRSRPRPPALHHRVEERGEERQPATSGAGTFGFPFDE